MRLDRLKFHTRVQHPLTWLVVRYERAAGQGGTLRGTKYPDFSRVFDKLHYSRRICTYVHRHQISDDGLFFVYNLIVVKVCNHFSCNSPAHLQLTPLDVSNYLRARPQRCISAGLAVVTIPTFPLDIDLPVSK